MALDGYTAEVTVQLPQGRRAARQREWRRSGRPACWARSSSRWPPPAPAERPSRSATATRSRSERSGRNPEVEEVLGALCLLLNGGGVAQLKTISTELNPRSRAARARQVVLDQVDTFMTQLDDNKADIVDAIESLNRLSVSLNEQDRRDRPRAGRPAAGARLDRPPARRPGQDAAGARRPQRVGLRVIQASKAATIDALEQLDPVLTQLAEAGDDLPKSLQVFLTYPFVDEVVGRDPAGGAQPAHGRLHQPVGPARPRPLRGSLPTGPRPPSTVPADPARPCCDALDPTECWSRRAEVPAERRPHQRVPKVLAPATCSSLQGVPENRNKVCKARPPVPTPTSRRPPAVTAVVGLPGDALLVAWPAAAGPGAARLRHAGRPCRRADGRLRPGPGQPAGPGDGDPMITRRTKIQLLVFVLITLVGVSYVGARYARLDRSCFRRRPTRWSRTSPTPAASSRAPR